MHGAGEPQLFESWSGGDWRQIGQSLHRVKFDFAKPEEAGHVWQDGYVSHLFETKVLKGREVGEHC